MLYEIISIIQTNNSQIYSLVWVSNIDWYDKNLIVEVVAAFGSSWANYFVNVETVGVGQSEDIADLQNMNILISN